MFACVVNLVLGVSVGLEMMFVWVFKFCQEELRDVEDGFDDLQPSNARQQFFWSFDEFLQRISPVFFSVVQVGFMALTH